ncbi:Concanavalin A-like lectin/glucanase superfamily [Artemisia annua]|uniref:non-specific serine/threonine protein kinase n=1 Tax=Artemisia annua TaxID=35608 RepID=A0A2U1MID6_ARTAN|nr:Concanavalin A-like lectin/glucanase superfamily [Artemisia annua]
MTKPCTREISPAISQKFFRLDRVMTGFGIAFVLCNTTEPAPLLAGTPAPVVLAVEFDMGANEFNESYGNHVGINLNNLESVVSDADYWDQSGLFVRNDMTNGQNVHAWIEFDVGRMEINVTIAAAGVRRPSRPLLSYRNVVIGRYLSSEMYVGFSSAKNTWVESAQRVLAWSFSDTGVARDLDTSGLPVFLAKSEGSSGLSIGGKMGVICGAVVFFVCLLGACYYAWVRYRAKSQVGVAEDWELEFWPHRYSYEDLKAATNGFSDKEVLGAGGFGKVYKGTLSNKTEVAVKCVNHDSNQGIREFMAEISSMGRLQHKNLVQMKGWCRKRTELLLVYDYMPNGSLNTWIFDKPKNVLGWEGRKKVLTDEVLGAGGFGKVYKGTLSNKTEVAVKCVNHDSNQGIREFMAEISSMGRLQHKNLVQMKGWCRKRTELLLVYDYMPNGSLNTWIFDKPKNVLGWEGRKKVLTDVAEGLSYLHHGWDKVVVHRDIKSSNVLLDLDMRGRLGDFGLAKLYTPGEEPKTTRVVGTLGYLAPELAMLASPTAASDVYSFGVVVLEVACGRKPIETWQEREEDMVLVDLVREKYLEGKLLDLADGRIKGEYNAEEMEAVLKLGLSCCHSDPQHRPTMKEVVALLLGEDTTVVPRVMLQESKTEPSPLAATDFLYNSFTTTTNLSLIGDARIEPPVIRLSNDSNQWSVGRAFYSEKIPILTNFTTNLINFPAKNATSFSTQFVFSILPDRVHSLGFGITFVLCNTTEPLDSIGGQYLGPFANNGVGTPAPLLVVKFMGGLGEFNDFYGNHVGINLNNVESVASGYWNESGGFVSVDMTNGQNVHVWIEFDGGRMEINVTIAPAGLRRPSRPLLSYRNVEIGRYMSSEMYVGFIAAKNSWAEAQRVLAWSFSDTGVVRDLSTSGLPVFLARPERSSGLSTGGKVGVICGAVVFFVCLLSSFYYAWVRYKSKSQDDVAEDWELEFWPHRYSYEDLKAATNGFSDKEVLGAGGFGKVYKGTLSNKTEVAVKCVNHDSKQGIREFMAEISSMGRLQHKNLVQMKGWCRKRNELLLVYDYMPNGSLDTWIFDKPKNVLGWEGRKKVLTDVAEGLSYLHHGWDKVVVHRDIKSSNVLLDLDMRGRLGDFGLAKLYTHGEEPGITRVVGTFGYLAPELAMLASPTAASDVYSFGVVVLEVACGRNPIETWQGREEDMVLVDLVREKYIKGKILDLADGRIKGEYNVEEMEAVLTLGLSCCHSDPQHRPTMKEVVALLLGEDTTVVPRVML